MIVIECQACGHSKTLSQKEIWNIRANYGEAGEDDMTIFNRIKHKFRCQKCRQRRSVLIVNEDF